ncbi:RagB/SusD family nutrient uptake outer membrane protein [Alistipes sp.]|uniref:RagB/SusD family nutrient uptake outer membrane protein n=1 Tax=Alistipes sp. TaxID=1872444 RepID=UPI0025C03291|nr:RagB/SusD family nutrient uptake outer membrane protein [Alistipes sp.]
MKNRKIISLLLLTLGFTSCADFFEREPFSQVGADTFFRSEKNVELFVNGLLQKNMPGYETLTYGDQYSDLMAVNSTSDYLKTEWSPEKQSGWDVGNWSNIYNVNYFLSRLPEAASDVNNEAKMKHYEGVGRFWRAWLYYAKVQTFGPVPWYDKPIDPEDEQELYKGRDSREFVMEKILEDLNFASTHCLTDKAYVNNSQINRWVALALKARICLYEGTYRKYHTELGLESSAGQWLREAVAACEILMNESPYSLVHSPANLKTQWRKLFTSEDVDYQEIIFANEFSEELLRFHSATWKFTSGSYGARWSLSKAFVNTYLMRDGSRFTDRSGYNKVEFAEEVRDRDYRLMQSIITPGYSKKVAGTDTPTAPDFSLTLTGYQVIKWSLDDARYEGTNNSTNSLSVFRFAEVLLNYAEAKAELGEFGEAEWNRTVKLLRERAGVNAKVPLSADPYLVAYYDNQSTDKWILEIRRERAIELLLENLRYEDLMRWKLGKLLEKEWDGIYIPEKEKAYDLNGDGINDVCVTEGKPGTEKGVVYIDLTKGQYTLNEDNCLVYNEPRMWADRKYLHPIPKTACVINPALGQNDGWGE